MQTNINLRTGGVQLLTPTELEEVRESFTIQAHSFKDKEPAQRKTWMADKVGKTWHQFEHVCGKDVSPRNVNHYKNGEHFDYMIMISSKKYVLGFALLSEETILYDDPTLARILENKATFDTDKTLNIKLLCARKGSGIGTRIVRVCENLGIRLKCASLHLDAVPTAYGFYKSVGFVPFNETELACPTIK